MWNQYYWDLTRHVNFLSDSELDRNSTKNMMDFKFNPNSIIPYLKITQPKTNCSTLLVGFGFDQLLMTTTPRVTWTFDNLLLIHSIKNLNCSFKSNHRPINLKHFLTFVTIINCNSKYIFQKYVQSIQSKIRPLKDI